MLSKSPEEENSIIELRKAIQEGIESGVVTSFDFENHLTQLKARKR